MKIKLLNFRSHTSTICFLALLVFFIASGCNVSSRVSQEKYKKEALRVFIIGNSFSNNATAFLPDLVKEGGYQLEIGRAELGGSPLDRHWNFAAAAEANPNDPKGKPYKGRSLRELLSEGKWDIVTIQQASKFSSDSNSYQPYADNLYKFIKSIQPEAKVVFHQTWAYRSDAKSFGFIGGKNEAQSDLEMYAHLKANYLKMAKQLHSGIIPVGHAFWLMSTNPVWGYKPQQEFKADTLKYPSLPVQDNSLHIGYKWDANKKLVFDTSHANDAGKYLGSLVWYKFLFNADLTKVIYKPSTVDAEFALQLKKAATNAFKEMKPAK